jgi:hypothetical protein
MPSMAAAVFKIVICFSFDCSDFLQRSDKGIHRSIRRVEVLGRPENGVPAHTCIGEICRTATHKTKGMGRA